MKVCNSNRCLLAYLRKPQQNGKILPVGTVYIPLLCICVKRCISSNAASLAGPNKILGGAKFNLTYAVSYWLKAAVRLLHRISLQRFRCDGWSLVSSALM